MAGAIRTDFILSTEIMAISLASITTSDILTQATVLFSVGVLVTAGVDGVVAIIAKADDFGVYLAKVRFWAKAWKAAYQKARTLGWLRS